MPHYQEPVSNLGPVGANIYRVRRKLRITQKQLAAPEFSISYISAIERGRIRPSLKALDILARRLSVSSAELLADLPDDYDPYAEFRHEGEAPPPSLLEMITQRRTAYPVPLALGWAMIALDEHEPELAGDLLNLLSPPALTAEQQLARSYLVGRMYLATNRQAEAVAELEPLLQQQDFNGSAELLERCRFLLACAYERQGKFLPAGDHFSATIQAIEQGAVRDPLFALEVYAEAAEHYRQAERRDVAIAYYQQALNTLEMLIQPLVLAHLSVQISQEHLAGARTMLSDWYAARGRALLELAESRHRLAQAAINLGAIYQESGNIADAERQLRLSIDLCERLGTRRQAILARMALADLLLERQETQQAESLALEAEALCRPSEGAPISDEVLYGRLLITLGSVYKALGRLDESEQTFKQTIEMLQAQHAYEQLSRAYYRYSELLHQKRQFAESYELVKQAYLLGQRKREE